MKRAYTFVAVVAACAAVVAFVVSLILGAGDGAPAASVDPAHSIPAATRTLVVSTGTAPVSRPGGLLHGHLVGGRMPRAAMMGEVLTDQDCAPDLRGISHCRNAVRLADGRTIVVRHPHSMAQVPCLTPGEHIRVLPA